MIPNFPRLKPPVLDPLPVEMPQVPLSEDRLPPPDALVSEPPTNPAPIRRPFLPPTVFERAPQVAPPPMDVQPPAVPDFPRSPSPAPRWTASDEYQQSIRDLTPEPGSGVPGAAKIPLWRRVLAPAVGALGGAALGLQRDPRTGQSLASPQQFEALGGLTERIQLGNYPAQRAAELERVKQAQALAEEEQKQNKEALDLGVKQAQIANYQSETDLRKSQATQAQATANWRNSQVANPNSPNSRVFDVAEVVRGADLTGKFQTDAFNNTINPNGYYKVARRGEDIVAPVPVTGQITLGDPVRVPSDESTTGWVQPILDRAKKIIGLKRNITPPVGYQPTTTHTYTYQTNAEGDIVQLPVTTTSGKEQPAPTPTTDLLTNQSSTPPTAPRPVTPPSPQSVVVGARPVSSAEKTNITNARSGLAAIQRVRNMIQADPNILVKAATPGSILAREFAAARKEAIDVVTRLRTGAALNNQEEEFYKNQFPTVLDLGSPEAVTYKLDLYERLFKEMSERGVGKTGNDAPNANIITTPDGKRWQKLANGSMQEVTNAR